MIAWVSPGADGQVDAAQDLLGALLGLDADVQVADLEGGHAVQLSFAAVSRGVDRGRDVDEHVVAVDGHGEDGHGPDRRQRRRLAGAQVEPGPVQPALDRAVLDLALGERDVGVRAGVADRRGARRPRRGRRPRRSPSRTTRTAPHGSGMSPAGAGAFCRLTPRTSASGCRHRRARARPRSRSTSRSSIAGNADLLDQLVEEAADDQPAGLVLGDAAGLQVEQLLVVEPAGGAGVAGADDLAGLDLEVRHRVGAGAVGQHEVAVELVGVGALGRGPDQDVTDPHGVRAVALQRALVDDVAAAVRHGVVDEEPVLEVLAGVGEVQAEQLDLRAGRGERRGRGDPDDVAAEGDDDVLEPGVAAEPGPRARTGGRRRRPSPGARRPSGCAPSSTTISTFVGAAAPPRWSRTTTPRRAALGDDHDMCAQPTPPRPVTLTVDRLGRLAPPAGTVTTQRRAEPRPRRARRPGPPGRRRRPSRGSSRSTTSRAGRRPARRASTSAGAVRSPRRPRAGRASRSSGVNRQSSSRPVGTSKSAGRSSTSRTARLRGAGRPARRRRGRARRSRAGPRAPCGPAYRLRHRVGPRRSASTVVSCAAISRRPLPSAARSGG